jgi:hypothetical protein
LAAVALAVAVALVLEEVLAAAAAVRLLNF